MENQLDLVGESPAESDTDGNKQVSVTPERVPGYGELLYDKIRTETKDFSTLNAFERFILNRGYLYDTEEELKAGYDRAWKAGHGLLVTAEEFEAEIKSQVKWDEELDVEPFPEKRTQKEKKKWNDSRGIRYRWLCNGEEKFILKTRGRNPTQSRVRAEGVVEHFQIGKDIALRRRSGWIVF